MFAKKIIFYNIRFYYTLTFYLVICRYTPSFIPPPMETKRRESDKKVRLKLKSIFLFT